MPKMTALEKQAMLEQIAKERSKNDLYGASDRVLDAGQQALDEQRRESRFSSPDLEARAKTAYTAPYDVTTAKKKGGKVKHKAYAKGGSVNRGDGIAMRGHTKGTMR